MHHQQAAFNPSVPKFLTIAIFILTLSHQPTSTISATSQQSSSDHHRHRHKHQFLTINSNQIHDIRKAFVEYRNAVGNKINFEELTPLRHHHKKHNSHNHESHETNNAIHEDETVPAIHQHQFGHHSMYRHKRLNGGTKAPTTRAMTTTTTVKTIDNYDEEYDDEESDINKRANDDAHVQSKSSQVR